MRARAGVHRDPMAVGRRFSMTGLSLRLWFSTAAVVTAAACIPTSIGGLDDAAPAPDGHTADCGSAPTTDVPAATPDVALPDGGCVDCVASTVAWGDEGGFVPFTDTSSIAPCRGFTHRRVDHSMRPDLVCANTVPACSAGDAPTIGDVTQALGHPDVAAALAAAPVIYGRDNRPIDAPIFQVTIGGRVIQVGSPCSASDPGCRPIPPGVDALRTVLRSVTVRQLRQADCSTTFPGV
jgi:hypothetical protein